MYPSVVESDIDGDTTMNANIHKFELKVMAHQVDEAVISVFHPIIFNRCRGKITFDTNDPTMYTQVDIQYRDVDCTHIDHTYVHAIDDVLDKQLKEKISAFSTMLLMSGGPMKGKISLEFYEKKKRGMMIPMKNVTWEMWTVEIQVVNPQREKEIELQEELIEGLMAVYRYIPEINFKRHYEPKFRNQEELDLVLDTSYPLIYPYLYKISYNIDNGSSGVGVESMVKMVKDALTM